MRGFELEVRGQVQFGGGDSPVTAPTLGGTGADAAGANSPRGELLDPAGTARIGQGFTPYGWDLFAFAITLGYRLHPSVSVGVFFSYASYSINDGADTGDAPDSTSRLSRQEWSLGAYGRYYVTFLHPRLQPWVELGVGYNGDIAAYSRPVGQAVNANPETGDYTLQQDGIVVPAAVGLDVRIAPFLSVGPTVGYARVFPIRGCVEVVLDNFAQGSSLQPTNTCSSPPVANSGYGVFDAGIYAKVTLDPFAR
jgi:hypothetical protein